MKETPELLKLGACCQPGSQRTFCCRDCPHQSRLLHHPLHGGAGQVYERQKRMYRDRLHHRPQR